ncbi:MAG: tRNA uridine-5-carboxymethylaminomethyl(34) synthesis enzyme MnmG [Clostridia bacterium]|nr:tRNA uridine-5-carboxymethylaminomethyl(34) synthesis enzyme MnmG [Clostridia bacterium]
MKEYFADTIDIAVIGAGHAGIEAGLAAARLGCETAVFTLNLDAVGNMPCNPAIGGTGKGQLVREIDALGGEMGLAADAVCLQSRMLNTGKGEAVQSLRMQSDRNLYRTYMKRALEKQPRLRLIQAEIVAVRAETVDGKQRVCEVVTRLGAVYRVKAVIIAGGTFLHGRIHIGEVNYEGGPDGMMASVGLSESLKKLGVELRRFKTGTPSRVDAKSIDFSKLERQDGDVPPQPFSYMTDVLPEASYLPCYSAWTNQKTHDVILNNLHRSPLYAGVIEGIGPRYCPSIEDKVVRFRDKERHQIFVEPVARDSDELYIQGMSSSLPEEVQHEFLHTIEGFENLRVMRTAYAIEYDCCDPLQLLPTLEFINVGGLFGAGQFNGTSGYEEAAAQGLIAGINAVAKIRGTEPLVLERQTSYIGTLIDDIVTKGVLDPYRMMTSRCEHRLLVRQDNADFRLTEIGRRIGLVDDARWQRFLQRKSAYEAEKSRISKVSVKPTEALNALLESVGCAPLEQAVRLPQLLLRPHLTYENLAPFDPERPNDLPPSVVFTLQTDLKYAGYIKIQQEQLEKLRKLEKQPLPVDFDYSVVDSLRLETREKLNKIRPMNLGQAARISGISPADVAVLSVWAQKHRKEQA